MSHRVTIMCDSCGQEYLLPPEMELPPYWIAIQITVSNRDGEIPIDVPDIMAHICSQECLKDFIIGDIIKSRIALIDKISDDEIEDEHDI